MSPQALICPNQQQLAAFAAGRLNITESAEIEQHLADCESCCQLLKLLPDEDTLVSLLRDRQAATTSQNSHDPLWSREAATVSPAGEQLTLPPGDGVTEIADATDAAAAISVPEPLRDHSRYRVTQLLGRGGMGDVYKAQHRMMNRPVALKVINAQLVDSPAAVQRFHREVQAAAKLTHPNIVTAFDAEQAGDTHYLVMEYVDGVELAEVIKDRGPLPVAQACDYVSQAAMGLQHAHEQGMVHRDIKPQNLMLTSTGRVKILDFGLANLAGAVAEEVLQHESGLTPHNMLDQRLTQLGAMMGTPDYMAPEQAEDAHSADIRADIYSLGCTLYCLLSGDAPFSEGSVSDKVQAHSQQTARPLSERRDDVPAELELVIARMMNKSPAGRYQVPMDVAKSLEPFVATLSTDDTTASKPTPQPRRSSTKPLVIAATLLLGFFVALAALIVVVTNHGRMVIQSEVGDVQVVVKQNGEEITTVDLKTGSRVKWLSTGKYELELVGADDDVKLDTSGFQMKRLGKVIVTARWNSGAIRAFTADDPTITRDGVEVADGGWKITATDTRTVRMFEVPVPNLKPSPFFYRAKLKTENVKGRAYLEMWARFPGQGEFFSKGFHNALSGTNGWAEYEIPFVLTKGQQPDLVKLNLTIEGSGTVWIKDIELRGRSSAPSDRVPPQAVWQGHEGPIRSLVFAADGRRALSASGYPYGDKTMRLWDVETAKEIRCFRGDGMSWVLCGAISPDGSRALSASWDGLRVWDVETATVLHRLVGHAKDKQVDCVVFSPDGNRALSGSADETIRLWDVQSGEQISVFKGPNARVSSVAFSPDGTLAVSGEFDNDFSVRLWDVASGDELQRFAGHVDAIDQVMFTADGSRIVSAGGDGIRLWDIEAKKLIRHIASSRIPGIALLNGDHRILAGGTDGSVVIWDLESGQQFERLAQLPEMVWSVAVSPDGCYGLAAGGGKITSGTWEQGSDFAIRQWQLKERD